MWWYRFIKCNRFAIRWKSHIKQMPPDNMNKLKENFLNEVNLKKLWTYLKKIIIQQKTWMKPNVF